MFVYLSKKIAIPNNTRINCLAWNKDEGYIAVGGEDGLLKVLRLEQASSNATTKGGLAAPSNLSMNQSLEGHKAPIQVVTWNEKQQKMTSSDRDGVIMVWILYKNAWFEEMTNDRKKSTVKGMTWTADGQKICIVYEDGAVIVGSVDGSRIWGKELKNTILTNVQWSPDGKLLLFTVRSGECHLYDNQGTFVMKLNVQCVSLGPSRSLSVVGLCWYNGPVSYQRPVLAICYENGKIQIMKHENDDIPVIVDCAMQAVACDWNHDGSILAVCGMNSDEKDTNQVMFYTPTGNHLRTLKLPGNEITSLSWEGKSLRIALAVDSFIFFANIRSDYMWCYIGKTIAYLAADTGKSGSVIVFWDTASNQCFNKDVDIPLGLASNYDHCVIAVENTKISVRESGNIEFRDKFYQLLICNSMGTTVDARYVDICPHYVAMNSNYVVIASKEQFLIWHFHTPKDSSTLTSIKTRKDKRYHVDDAPSGVAEVLSDLDKAGYEPPVNAQPSMDPICSIAVSERILLIGRESGAIQEYTLPNVALCNRHILQNRASKISINCNSTKAAVIDSTGFLTTIDLTNNSDTGKTNGKVERKDVWAMCWARDNPQLLAIMEKTRMYVLRGADPEEPISCSGYICNFEDLEIRGVLLDDIINGSMTPDSAQHLLQLRIKSLRDTEELLAHVGITEAKQFIEDNPHPRLWKLLAQASLKKLDIDTAESAFVRCTNYPGLQLIKRLRTIQNENLQKAEVAAFYGEFDEAEKLYIDEDRRDLAIKLRQTLCDWFRTVQLYRMGPGISDQQMEEAWWEIGNHFANLRSWESAKEYFEKAHDMEGLINSLYHLEQYDELEACIAKLPEKSPLLGKLGHMLESVGMCDEAVSAYLKMADHKAAVNACVNLRNWGQAVELAQKYKMPQVGQLLDKHAAQLLKEEKLHEAVELQKKAGRHLNAARLMMKLAEGEVEKGAKMLRVKQLYVLAGTLVEEHLKNQSNVTGENRSTVLSHLMPEDSVLIEQIWHRVEAYHFFLLAQRQLRSGLMHSAVLTALRLREYEDILNPEDIYALLALASCADRSFGICSKAFIKLESLETIPESRREEYEEIAVNIFSKHEPTDNRNDQMICYTCESIISDWNTSCTSCGTFLPACIASGQSVPNPIEAWQCTGCHHVANRLDVATRKTCPLCHTVIASRGIEL